MKHSRIFQLRISVHLLVALMLAFHVPLVGQVDAQPPATESEERSSELEEGMRRFWNRFGGRNRASIYQRSHDTVKASFVEVSREAAQSTVRILVDGAQASLGTVVNADGLVLAKGSELRGDKELTCELYDNRTVTAVKVGGNEEYDFALLKLDATHLKPATWSTASISVGAWVVTPGHEDVPVSIGVVSVAPRRIPKSRALIGVKLGPNPSNPAGGALVAMVFPTGGAERAGVKVDDIIIRADERDITTPEDLIAHVSGLLPGDRVRLTVQRGEDEKVLTAELQEERALSQARIETQNSLGGPISRRRSGFPRVIQHDSVLRPEQCGGPIVDLDGKVVGLNIARAGRVASYAIPAQEVLQVLPTMMENMDSYPDQLKSQQIAELQRNIDRSKTVLTHFRIRLEEAIKERDDVDPKLTELVKMRAERVERLESRVKDSESRIDKLMASLVLLQGQPVTKQEQEQEQGEGQPAP